MEKDYLENDFVLTDENKYLLKIVGEWSNLDNSTIINNALTLYFKEVIRALEVISVNGNNISAFSD